MTVVASSSFLRQLIVEVKRDPDFVLRSGMKLDVLVGELGRLRGLEVRRVVEVLKWWVGRM